MPYTFNGVGTTYYGQRDAAADGSYVTTLWVTALWVPLLPLCSYRVLPVGTGTNVVVYRSQNYQTVRVPLCWPQVRNVYLCASPMRDDATQAWLEIQEAFAVLSDLAKREEYDTLLEEMRQSEEAEKQFEPVTPPPAPPKQKTPPAPTPRPTTTQPTPQPPPTPPTKFRSAWLGFCFQVGRHWREVCLIVAVALFIANGSRDSEAWTVMSVGIIFTSTMAVAIVVASGPSWRDKRRYIANTLTLVALFITGITAMSISTSAPAPKTAEIATTHSASLAATDNTPSSSTAPFADMLKKYGFEAMPPDCKNVPLNELDSCLAKLKADLENKHLQLGQATKRTTQKAPAAIQDAPTSTTLTGSFLGTVHNVNANLEARFVLFIEEHQGVLQGCFGVKPPLYGSGPLQGSIKGDDFQFDVTSPQFFLHFLGHRNSAKGWSGTYTARPLGGKEQYGYYEVEKNDSKRYFKNFDPGTSCPTDKNMNQ
jgi:hypothetical protein